MSAERASLFEHCIRAIERSLTAGRARPAADRQRRLERRHEPGRPPGPRRERVARLVPVAVLQQFAPLVRARGDQARAARYRQRAQRGSATMLEQAWDGDWYRRAYFDDGTPLGSAQNEECRIDSISQTWAVLSGAAPLPRPSGPWMRCACSWCGAARALVLLLTPPFDQSPQDPGYIKGYPPGVRENGGQYTHAAIWTVMAMATARQRRRGGRAVPHAEPDQPHPHRRRRRALQGRALRHRGRRLRPPGAHRPGRLDLVHRLGRMDVPRRAGEHPRPEAPRGNVRAGSLHPGGVAGNTRSPGRFGRTRYEISVSNPQHRCRGIARRCTRRRRVRPGPIPLVDDGTMHRVD